MAPVDLSSPPLCKICSSRPSKYQCPRCSRRTCSLACCVRHKRLYDCSGRRDPTARLSRAQLTRGDAYDDDYNFLTGLERVFENADRDAERREFAHQLPEGQGRAPRKVKAERVAEELRATHVHVHRLPHGMSRRRINETHWMPKRKQIQWTVEWLHPDGSKSFGQCNAKSHPVGVVYYDTFLSQTTPGPSLQEPAGGVDRKANHVAALSDAPAQSTHPVSSEVDHKHRHVAASNMSRPRSDRGYGQLHSYLVKPFTRGKEKVLIPIDGLNLQDALRGREIIEFPTVQILPQAEDQLPPGFVLEKYYSGHGIQLLSESSSAAPEAKDQAAEEPVVTPARVMESLQKDIAALASSNN